MVSTPSRRSRCSRRRKHARACPSRNAGPAASSTPALCFVDRQSRWSTRSRWDLNADPRPHRTAFVHTKTHGTNPLFLMGDSGVVLVLFGRAMRSRPTYALMQRSTSEPAPLWARPTVKANRALPLRMYGWRLLGCPSSYKMEQIAA